MQTRVPGKNPPNRHRCSLPSRDRSSIGKGVRCVWSVAPRRTVQTVASNTCAHRRFCRLPTLLGIYVSSMRLMPTGPSLAGWTRSRTRGDLSWRRRLPRNLRLQAMSALMHFWPQQLSTQLSMLMRMCPTGSRLAIGSCSRPGFRSICHLFACVVSSALRHRLLVGESLSTDQISSASDE